LPKDPSAFGLCCDYKLSDDALPLAGGALQSDRTLGCKTRQAQLYCRKSPGNSLSNKSEAGDASLRGRNIARILVEGRASTASRRDASVLVIHRHAADHHDDACSGAAWLCTPGTDQPSRYWSALALMRLSASARVRRSAFRGSHR
jgi:hypothetical protein